MYYTRDKEGKFSRAFFRKLFSWKTLVYLWVGTFITTFSVFAYSALISVDWFKPIFTPVEAQKALTEPNIAPESLSIQEYVFTEVEKALGFDEAVFAVSMIGGCENPEWKSDIVIIEPNNTVSLGIWQINTVHNDPNSIHYISNADKLDYKKATAWAINKRIKDGNWSAWSCSK